MSGHNGICGKTTSGMHWGTISLEEIMGYLVEGEGAGVVKFIYYKKSQTQRKWVIKGLIDVSVGF